MTVPQSSFNLKAVLRASNVQIFFFQRSRSVQDFYLWSPFSDVSRCEQQMWGVQFLLQNWECCFKFQGVFKNCLKMQGCFSRLYSRTMSFQTAYKQLLYSIKCIFVFAKLQTGNDFFRLQRAFFIKQWEIFKSVRLLTRALTCMWTNKSKPRMNVNRQSYCCTLRQYI